MFDAARNIIRATGIIIPNPYSVVSSPPLHLSCVVSTDISAASSMRYAISMGDAKDIVELCPIYSIKNIESIKSVENQFSCAILLQIRNRKGKVLWVR